MKKGGSWSAVPKGSAVVSKGSELRNSALYRYNGYTIYFGKVSAPKKKKIARVSPCFLHLKILKEPFWAT
jgi:hypothetical protein